MAYLIDTDIFISAKNLHYGMDFCPAFWDWLIQANRAGKLLSTKAVLDELIAGQDELATWAKARDDRFFIGPLEYDLPALGHVSQWINEHPIYTTAAKQSFLGCADYFVVSQALAGNHTVITNEKPKKLRQAHQNSQRVRGVKSGLDDGLAHAPDGTSADCPPIAGILPAGPGKLIIRQIHRG